MHILLHNDMLEPCDLVLLRSVRVEPRERVVSRAGVPPTVSEWPSDTSISWADLDGGEPY